MLFRTIIADPFDMFVPAVHGIEKSFVCGIKETSLFFSKCQIRTVIGGSVVGLCQFKATLASTTNLSSICFFPFFSTLPYPIGNISFYRSKPLSASKKAFHDLSLFNGGCLTGNDEFQRFINSLSLCFCLQYFLGFFNLCLI